MGPDRGPAASGATEPGQDDAREAPDDDEGWTLSLLPQEDGASIEESLFCVADGVIGTRGMLEEAGATSPSSVVVGGLYEADERVVERIVSIPSWCGLPLRGPGAPGRRVLDLRDGTLTREVRREGRLVLRTTRFACAGRPGTAVLVAELSSALCPGGDVPPASASTSVYPTGLGGGVAVATATAVSRADRADGGVRVERVAAHAVAPRRRPRVDTAKRALDRARRAGVPWLVAEQRRVWRHRWEGCDVEVVGDVATTRAVRLALFHLLGSVGRRGDAAVGARGLTGPAYAGHVFWDTEAFVLPVLAAVDPRAARAALDYRLHRLDAARRRARREGREGSRFPWESAATGEDVTPTRGIDQHGREVQIRTGQLEEHVTADVAWGAWRLAAWEGDWSLLAGPMGSLVVEPARYWASRIRHDQAGRGHIDAVTGPDEYHEDVDDNAFTNLMARWTLGRAADLVELGLRDDVTGDEADSWRRAAASLVDNYDPATRRYEQFDGFDRLDPLAARSVAEPPFAADLVLGSGRLARAQIIKQADVLMAHHLVPEEVACGSLVPNLDHYLPRTAHGSSLSPTVHATLLARAGRPNEALELLQLAASIDVEDVTETTAGGLHLANLGGIWQTLVHGFGGVAVRAPDDGALVMDPILPDGWEELRLRVRWHGRRIRCRIDREGVEVGCDRPVTVCVHGELARLEPPGGRVS